MAAYKPHKQLKAIRARLGISQEKAAAMLGVSYPYFISIETGQRALSSPLAAKIAKTFGVLRTRLRDKNAEPMIRDSKGNFVPFIKDEYVRYKTARPSFWIDPDFPRQITPTTEDYAQCARALLTSAEEQGTLRPVVMNFADWFAKSISSDAMFESLRKSFDRLFPGQRKKSDAFAALTDAWARGVEDEIVRDQQRKEKAAEIASRKRKKERRKKR